MLIDDIGRFAKETLINNKELLTVLVANRKRFEAWLQLEIFNKLISHENDNYGEIEKNYPNTKERCDFWLNEIDGEESWIELKTCVTNYSNKFTINQSSRPITNQINDVIRDVNKLYRVNNGSNNCNILLITYPLPVHLETHHPWFSHIEKISTQVSDISQAFKVELKRSDQLAQVHGYKITI